MAGAENVEYPQIKTQTKRIRAFQFPVLWNMRLKKSLWIATNSWVSLILLLWLVSNGAGLSPSKTFIYHEKAHSKRRSKLFLSKRESISSDQEHIFKPVFPVQSLYPAYRFPATPDIPLAFLSLSPFQTRFKFLNSSSFHPPHPPPPSPQSPSFSQRMWETLRHADCLGPISHSLFNYTGMPRSCKCLRKSTVSRLKHCLKHKPVHFSVCNMTASCTYNKKT